jgi:hypothetical protein
MESALNSITPASYSVEDIKVAPNIHDLNGQFDHTVSYLNGFNETVSIVLKNDIRMQIAPAPGRKEVSFIVRHTYRVPRAILFDADKLLVNDPDITIEKRILNKAGEIVLSDEYNVKNTEYFAIDFIISRDAFVKRGSNIYIPELDIVISNRLNHKCPKHPLSEKFRRNLLLDFDNKTVNSDVFGYTIRIIDNNGIYGDRYVNLNGKAYRIPARKDNLLLDGVYCNCSHEAIGNYDTDPVSKKYSFNEADKALGLYKTIEDALTYGDPTKIREKELEQLKLETKEREIILTKEKSELEFKYKQVELEKKEETAKAETMRKELEHALHVERIRRNDYYEEASIRRKDRFEERSVDRKDWTEILKFVPAIIGAIATGYLAWEKFKSAG